MVEPERAVLGPDGGFVKAFLAQADDSAGNIVSGDVLDCSEISVYGGTVLSCIAEDSELSELEYVRLRVRVRVRKQENCAPRLPVGKLLVKGVNVYKGIAGDLNDSFSVENGDHGSESETWTAVSCSAVPNVKVSLGECVREFFVYEKESIAESPERVGLAWFDQEDWFDAERLENTNLSALWDRFQTKIGNIEGVAVRDGGVPNELVQGLTSGIEDFLKTQKEPDWHPNTDGVVLDVCFVLLCFLSM